MAARKAWLFFVYELIDESGATQYIGKGSGRRLQAQKKNFSLDGREIACFKREVDAYAFEVEKIAECAPALNKHKGGNGSKKTITKARVPSWVKEMDRIGTKAYAARLLLRFGGFDMSKIEEIRRVAYG